MTSEMIDTPFELIAIDLDGTSVGSVGDLHFAVTKVFNITGMRRSVQTLIG